VRHRITTTLSYKKEFIDGHYTRFSLFGTANEGQPISYTFSDSADMFLDDNDDRSLIYVPLENDPNAVYGSVTNDDGVTTPFDLEGFNRLIEEEGLTRGAIMDRNSSSADWWVKFDIRVEQELPSFFEGHKASAFLVIENVGNLLNDDWGVFRQGTFVGDDVITASINDQNQYVYEAYNASEQSINRGASLWEVRVGVKYKF
jgi:hypothetical protein